jgi:hypothetical protein
MRWFSFCSTVRKLRQEVNEDTINFYIIDRILYAHYHMIYRSALMSIVVIMSFNFKMES